MAPRRLGESPERREAVGAGAVLGGRRPAGLGAIGPGQVFMPPSTFISAPVT